MLMTKMLEIKAMLSAGRVMLELNTDGVPRLLVFDPSNNLLSTQTPPDQGSDLAVWLDGIIDGLDIAT